MKSHPILSSHFIFHSKSTPDLLGRRLLAATAALLIQCAGSAIAETEPNNVLGDANPVAPNGSISAAIDPGNDADWFQITVPGPGRLTASIPAPPGNMRTDMAFWNRHAEYAWTGKSAINPGDALELSFDVTEAGTYFLRVLDKDGVASAGSYTLQTQFTEASDAHEPNGRIGLATLATASPMAGKIFPAGENDYFRIYITDGQPLHLELNTPAEMRGQISLYGRDLQYLWVSAAAANPGDTVYLDYTPNWTGMIHIRVQDADGHAHFSDYSLSLTGGTPGYEPPEPPVTAEAESNDTIGTSNRINPSSTVTGEIAVSDDKDWFTFVPGQTGQATFTMDSLPANLKLEMRLYNDSGSHIMSARSGEPGETFSMTFDISTLNRYYIRIHDIGNSTAESTYQFSGTLVPVNDPNEPNGNYGDRTQLSDVNQIQGWIFPAGDWDWYEIHATNSGELRATLSNLPENITPRISLYNLSRERLAFADGTPGTDLTLSYALGAPGTYLLAVNDAHGNDSTLPYTLTVFGADFAHYAPVASIDSIDPGAIVVGDTVTFTGSGTDADGTISAYEWTSSIDGLIGTQASFSSSALSIGTHTISLRVRDNTGIWSTKVEELLYVGSAVSEETEPNGSFFTANEIALNLPFTGKIDASRDEDFIKVYLPGPGRVVPELTNVPTNLQMNINLFNRHWEYLWISGSAASPGDDVSATYDATQAGFLYLKVKNSGDAFNADFTYTLTIHYYPADDAFEPNDDLLHAAELSQASLDAYLFPSKNDDWYKVWVPQGGALHAEVVSVPADVRATVRLYGPDREYLWRGQTAVNPGDPVAATADPAPHAGYYYIRVNPEEGLNWADTYTLNITGADPGHVPDLTPLTREAEDNNSISMGNPIATGTTVSGTFDPASDHDWFRFVLSTPGILHVDVTDIPETIRAMVRIYRDDAGNIASRTASNPGDPLSLDVNISDPGIYHLLLNPADGGQQSPDSYALNLAFTPVADPNEPNNHHQDATVLSDQNRVQGYIFNTGDVDWFRVHSENGSTLRVSIGEVPASIRPQLGIYNHDGARLASKLASNDGQSITLSQPIDETGDYFVLVQDVGNNSFSADPYLLVIDGAVFDSYVPLAVIDSVAPNPAASGETVTLEGHGEDVDGSIIAYEWRSSIDGVFSISQVAETSALSTGEHTIHFRVKDDDGNWSPEVSTLLYYAVPAPAEQEPNNNAGSATPMDLGKQYTGAMNSAGDPDWFRIHLAQAGRLTIQGSNPVGSVMRLKFDMYTPDLDYSWVQATASNDGDPISLTWDLDQPGDYYLLLRDTGNREGGEYTVSANLDRARQPIRRLCLPERRIRLVSRHASRGGHPGDVHHILAGKPPYDRPPLRKQSRIPLGHQDRQQRGRRCFPELRLPGTRHLFHPREIRRRNQPRRSLHSDDTVHPGARRLRTQPEPEKRHVDHRKSDPSLPFPEG